MKFLCQFDSAGPSFVRAGWCNALRSMGHGFAFWDRRVKPVHDAFSEEAPDVFLGTTYDLPPVVLDCILSRPALKIALFASAWGERVDNVDRVRFPIDLVSEGEKKIVSSLVAGRRVPVFLHVSDARLEGVLGGWRSIGCEPLGLLNAFDAVAYAGAVPRPELGCDWAFVGNRWPYKARNLDPYILPLAHPSSGLRGRIFGSAGWDTVGCWLGRISVPDERDLFVSARVCPNISEPHSTEPSLGHDVVERVFKAAGAGGFVISDRCPEARELFDESELPMTGSPAEMFDMVRAFSAHPGERLPYMRNMRARVLAEHTYRHRMEKLLGVLA